MVLNMYNKKKKVVGLCPNICFFRFLQSENGIFPVQFPIYRALYLTPSFFLLKGREILARIATGMSIRSEFFARTTRNASRDRGAFYEAFRYGFRRVRSFFSRKYDGPRR
ncbi:hypothetical protein TSAR_003521 [Trichomalopsis sarcophagae]|uniref:Uncharacterized protein n=1 Tax=Trichomalopsis sarcophagae TaxID=543379 RepID=A0A232FLB6_9HYME|nr:hypothetical protein TSAR_003521 [Trichomalopsis sarcophagae]